MAEGQASSVTGLPLTEAEFQRLVIDLAQKLGYLVAHFRPGRNRRNQWTTAVQGDGKGYPDLTLVGRGQVLFVELKTDDGELADDQEKWLEHIRANGGTALLWRPRDWDEIVDTLNVRKARAS